MKTTFFVLAMLLTISGNLMAQSSTAERFRDWEERTLAGFYVGQNAGLGMPNGMSLNLYKSREIGFDLPVFDVDFSDQFIFHVNLGFNWKNFRMTKNDRSFVKDYTTGEVSIGLPNYYTSALGTGQVDYSRMKIFSITLPFLFEYRFTERWFVAAGPVVNFNLHGSLLTKFTNDRGEHVVSRSNGLRQSVITADLKLLIGHEDVAIYGKWSPCRQLRKRYAPELDFTGISFGIQAVL